MIYILKIKKPQTTAGKVLLVVSIIAIAIVVSVIAILVISYTPMGPQHFPVDPPHIFFDKQEDDNYWNLTVSKIVWEPPESSLPKDCVRLSNIKYAVFPNDTSGSLEYAPLSNITDKPSGYNITFLDNDRDGMVSVNDTMRVSKSGGTKGTIKTGGHVILLYELIIITYPNHIYL